jgi:hypothetical protein
MSKTFESTRHFQIWIYTVSHSTLILRGTNREDEETEGYNIDIEFWGVAYLDLPDMLKGIIIKEIQENIPEKFHKYSNSLGYRVFEIKSEGGVFYVVATGYRVGKNNWDREDRILNPNLEYDEIVATS